MEDLLDTAWSEAEKRTRIRVSRRGSTAQGFGNPAEVRELEKDDSNSFPSWISADDCEIYLTSNRQGGQGNFDLYRARRPPPP